jgi:membrane protease YdiL (CAAX protease family)
MANLIGLAVYAALVAIEVLWSPGYMASIRTRVAAGDPDARRAMYRFSIVFSWVAAAIAVAIIGIDQVIRLPIVELGDHAGFFVGGGIGVLVGGAITYARSQRGQATIGDIDVLVPRTTSERRWFAGVAVTAGIAEEIAYRALPIVVLGALLPSVSPWWFVAISSIVFGLAHLYQGIAGVIAVAVLGGAFGAIYVATGSLVIGMVLHVLVDLRMLLIRATDARPAPARS